MFVAKPRRPYRLARRDRSAQRERAAPGPARRSLGHSKPQAERVGGLIGRWPLLSCQISQGPRHPKDPVHAPGAELAKLHRTLEPGESASRGREAAAQLAPGKLRVEPPGCAREAERRALASQLHAPRHRRAGFRETPVAE